MWDWMSYATSNHQLATGDWWWVVNSLGHKISSGMKNDVVNTQYALTEL